MQTEQTITIDGVRILVADRTESVGAAAPTLTDPVQATILFLTLFLYGTTLRNANRIRRIATGRNPE